MKMMKKAIIAAAVATASVGSFAASAGLTVIGTVTPEACGITLAAGGAVDFGALSSATVKGYPVIAGNSYRMPDKPIALEVTCAAPTAVAINWTDNRAASRLPVNGDDAVRAGLGVSGSSNIGAYQVSFGVAQVTPTTGGTAAAAAGVLVRAKNTTGAWTASSGLNGGFFMPTLATGFKQVAADTAPPALVKLTANLLVQAFVSKTLIDSATTAVTLDGSSTFNLEYI